MTRTLRKLLRTANGALRGSRSAWLGGLLCGLLPVSSCLVTENTDFRGSTSRPVPIAIRPLPYTRVPYVSDSFCSEPTGAERAMRFESIIDFEDLDQPLYAVLVVNGRQVRNPLLVPPSGTVRREPRPAQQCVPYTTLDLPCNLVELITSSDLEKLNPGSRPPEGALNPDFGVVWWLVRGASADLPGANDNDCAALFSDGGV